MAPQGHDVPVAQPPSNVQPPGANSSCEDRPGAGIGEPSGAPTGGAAPRDSQGRRSPTIARDGAHHGGGQPCDHSGGHGQSQIKVTISTVGTATRASAGGGAGSSSSSRAGAHDINGSHPSSFSSTGPAIGSGGGGGKSGERQPADAQQTQICYGLTYFSQAMLHNQKMPSCAGWKSRPDHPPDLRFEEPETAPQAELKFVCAGVSVYDVAQLRKTHADLQRDPTAPVQLPYCEGLEVVSAANLSPARAAPVLLKEGGVDAATGTAPVAAAQPPKPPRSHWTPRVEFAEFSSRFFKTANKVVGQMGTNINFIAVNVKRALGINDK